MTGISIESINNFFVHNPIFTVSIGLSAFIATLVYLFGFSHIIRQELKRRRMKHHIHHLKDHYILCGFGRVGQQVARELDAEHEPFIIIERDEARLEPARVHNWAYLLGDVALDESLFNEARIDAAKALIIAVGTDADAIFMAVSARALNKDIFIVSRASGVEAADKLSKIGVNRVALPYQIGGYHMATMALRPTVVDFLDLLVDQEHNELEMEEYIIHDSSYYEGKTVEEAGFSQRGLAILAIRHKNGKSTINPLHSIKLAGGDKLVIMGSVPQLEELTKNFSKHQKHTHDQPKQKEATVVVTDVKPSPFVNQG